MHRSPADGVPVNPRAAALVALHLAAALIGATAVLQLALALG